MSRKLIIGITTLAVLATFLFSSFAMAATDTFETYTNNDRLADTTSYSFVSFPGVGAGDNGTGTTTKWETDTGTFYAKQDSSGNKWGYLPSTDLFRLNTQDTAQNAIVTWRYKASGTNNAADVWLRYQTQYWLYIIQFDRNDGCLVAKRKVPTNNNGQWSGPAVEIANKGVYYTLLLDTDTPAHAGGSCNVDGLTWTQLSTSTITHNGTLNGGNTYNFKATITTVTAGTGTCTGVSFNCAKLQLYRGGVLVASWTDKNDAKNYNGTRTFQQDWDNGYYNNVTGHTESWGYPIYAAGKSGIRNDDALEVWIDDWSMTEAGGDVTAPTPNPASFSTVPTNDAAGQITMTATLASDITSPVEYMFAHTACISNGGTGGTSSSWQAGRTYTDTGLQTNQCYGYTVQARDGVPNTGTASAVREEYSSAATPGAPTISSVTTSSFALANAANGNPSSNPTTNFAVQIVNTADAAWNNKYVNASGQPSATAVWMSDATIDTLTVLGLTPATSYEVKVKARNHESDETAFSSATTQITATTVAPAPDSSVNRGMIRLLRGTIILR